jgi:SAM-dependent methyltransferase
MLLEGVRNLFARRLPPIQVLHAAVDPAALLAPGTVPPDDDDPVWPSARVSVAEALWGEGFLFPGGGSEVLRLAKPLGLSAASSLLLIGAGTGGPPRRIAAEFGVWVTGYEANPHLVEVANERIRRAGLGRRAQVEPWDPSAPRFPPRYFHHGIVVDALSLAPPEPLLTAASRALKPGGQLVLLETVADLPLDRADPMVAAWSSLDHCSVDPPSELAITDVLARLGFDVRVVEDVSRRAVQNAIQGWRGAVQAMAEARPALRQVAMVVREAELWLARCRLMRSGRLRLVRWHAIADGA